MLNDTLASALSRILNAERTRKKECLITPCSSVIRKVLDLLNEEGYIGKYEEVTKEKGGVMKLHLLGKVNNCGVIKPNFTIKRDEFEKFEKRFLLAEGFGIIIVSTNKGLMTHEKAKEKKIGGKLIAFCY
jgi:small subunit ribosomal protein S8